MTNNNRAFGLFALRALLGIVFMMQGFSKLFQFGIWNIYDVGFKSFESTLPMPLLVAVLFFTTFAELLGGALLILGWQRGWTYRVLAVLLLIVSFGHGMESPAWDTRHVAFRAIFLFPLFFLPDEWDTWSMDHRLRK